MSSSKQSTKEYQKLNEDYQLAYQDYLKKMYLGSKDVDEARNELIRLNGLLESQVKSASGEALSETAKSIERKTLQIYEKAKLLDIQKDLIEKKNDELHSKKRQIEMGVQKNKYRRNIILILLTLNIILLAIFYYFYKKSSA